MRFYDFQRRWANVDHLVEGVGDVLAQARQNGAVDGTPFFVDPWGRADPLINAFWRAPKPGAMGLKVDTLRRYAFSLKVWLDFLHVIGVRWEEVGRDELAMFKQWRLSTEENPDAVMPSSFQVDRAAIRRFYEWAARHGRAENPVRVRAIVRGIDGRAAREVLEGTPAAIRRADVKWLTPEAFRLWRNVGLRGFALDGLPVEAWRGRTEDRDVAFVEGLFGTGLRLGEWSSQLTIELPSPHEQGLFRGQLSAACAKGSVGRPFWMRRRVAGLVRFYVEDGGRSASIARAQAARRYDSVAGRWLLREVRNSRLIRVVDDLGRLRDIRLDAMTPQLRMRLFRESDRGLEPVWLWLNYDGTPRPKQAWYKTFDRANTRVSRALGTAGGAPRLWCRPHMLRHSFALRWYCIATFVAWHRTDLLSKEEQRDFRNQLGDVWYLMATLLGHSSAEVTREVYLEPFKALEVEALMGLMEADDRHALERLVDALTVGQPRVLTGTNA
ncbi:site-specific integrase [Nocardia araoensis]|uniref:site-specific integrase n=1 Tax=Nocardia araoensis TaxID=228600 RepID=UPI001FE19ABA|nr:site-specific integrase [Nocardia araoensis]